MRVLNVAVLAIAVTSSHARVLHSLLGRAFTDICGNVVNQNLAVNIGAIRGVVIGRVSACLCVSSLSGFENANIVAQAAIAIAGEAETTRALTALIQSSASHRSCTYPDNYGTQICSASNVCGFSCKNGFVASPAVNPTQCICPAPNRVCNGQCVASPACPSNVPVKRDLDSAKRTSFCDAGYTACGVFGSSSWECVDTKSDLESCGGCMLPLTLGSPRGIDCTAIQGVSDVSCVSGRCIVDRCLSGYTLTDDKSFCVRDADLEALDTTILASSYGLEHVPLVHREDD